MPRTFPGDACLAEKPLLSIAIPTYNRATFLQEILGSLLPQISPEMPVELIISDNCSTDGTEGIVRALIKEGHRISYVRNSANIGPDANILQCFEAASGSYAWVLGDDDVILEGSISKLLYLLKSDYSIVYLSPSWFQDDFRTARRKDPFSRAAEKFTDNSQFVNRVGPSLTFISSVIVNKSQFIQTGLALDRDVLAATNLGQLGYIFPVLARGKNFLIVWDRFLAARANNSGDYGICRIFATNLNRMIDRMLAADPKLVKTFRNRLIHTWFPYPVLSIRRGDARMMRDESLRDLLESEFSRYWRYWFYLFPLITLPLGIAEAWNKVVIFLDRVRITLMAAERFLLHRDCQRRLEI
jgi:abequosyltransferase